MTTGAGGQIRTLIQGTRQPSPPLNETLPSVGRLLTLLGTGSGISLTEGQHQIGRRADRLGWIEQHHDPTRVRLSKVAGDRPQRLMNNMCKAIYATGSDAISL